MSSQFWITPCSSGYLRIRIPRFCMASSPDLLHVVPVLDNSVLKWVLEDKDTTLLHGLLTDVVVLVGALEHSLVLWVSNARCEGNLRGILSGKTA